MIRPVDSPRRARATYIAWMLRAIITATFAFTAAGLLAPARAQDATRELNALRDAARAQERQAEALRQMRQDRYERAVQIDRDRRNAERDSRSARRFDRP